MRLFPARVDHAIDPEGYRRKESARLGNAERAPSNSAVIDSLMFLEKGLGSLRQKPGFWTRVFAPS